MSGVVKKLSLGQCLEIIGKRKIFSEVELSLVRDYLYVLAEIEYSIASQIADAPQEQDIELQRAA